MAEFALIALGLLLALSTVQTLVLLTLLAEIRSFLRKGGRVPLR